MLFCTVCQVCTPGVGLRSKMQTRQLRSAPNRRLSPPVQLADPG